jgi:1-acyl-sn-glycerol-3-phosphate acyltransferase
MRIAVLGWGSLIWSPGNLKIDREWHEDGPFLPIEFARVSQDGRLTLVLFPTGFRRAWRWKGHELE